jgi:hypothetical protein
MLKFGSFILIVASVVLCAGCGSSTGNTSGDDFTHSTNVDQRIEQLKTLLPEAIYDTITAGSRDNILCREDNRATLGLSDLPNGQWYYTYDNLIAGMAELEQFANEGDENTKKLEIAAFLANIAQETGAQGVDDPYGGPGCYIQEGRGSARGSQIYSQDCGSSCAAAGYCGRGPHQLSWDYNYKFFGDAMGVGNAYFNDPDVLTTDPEIGIAGSIWFWGHEEYTASSPPNIPFKPSTHDVLVGDWTPTTPSTPNVRTSNDTSCGRTAANFGVIINIINGGVECGPTASDQGRINAANRVSFLQAIAEVMGVTIPAGFLDDCSTQKNFAICTSY